MRQMFLVIFLLGTALAVCACSGGAGGGDGVQITEIAFIPGLSPKEIGGCYDIAGVVKTNSCGREVQPDTQLCLCQNGASATLKPQPSSLLTGEIQATVSDTTFSAKEPLTVVSAGCDVNGEIAYVGRVEGDALKMVTKSALKSSGGCGTFPSTCSMTLYYSGAKSSSSCSGTAATTGGGGGGGSFVEGLPPKDIAGCYKVAETVNNNSCNLALDLEDIFCLCQDGDNLTMNLIRSSTVGSSIDPGLPPATVIPSTGTDSKNSVHVSPKSDIESQRLTGIVSGNSFRAEGTVSELLNSCSLSGPATYSAAVNEDSTISGSATLSLSGTCGGAFQNCPVAFSYSGTKASPWCFLFSIGTPPP